MCFDVPCRLGNNWSASSRAPLNLTCWGQKPPNLSSWIYYNCAAMWYLCAYITELVAFGSFQCSICERALIGCLCIDLTSGLLASSSVCGGWYLWAHLCGWSRVPKSLSTELLSWTESAGVLTVETSPFPHSYKAFTQTFLWEYQNIILKKPELFFYIKKN